MNFVIKITQPPSSKYYHIVIDTLYVSFYKLQVPVVHNVSVTSIDGADVEVSDFMESDFCQVIADTGNVQAHKIKAESLNITTNSGEIFCSGAIQGAVKISSATGNVIADQRFTGPSLDISTDSGDVSIM